MTGRVLGRSGLCVSALGPGCMGMSEFDDSSQMDDAESIRVIHRHLDSGGNFLDTADMYGVGRNEEIVGRAIKGRRDRDVLATKFGNVRGPGGEEPCSTSISCAVHVQIRPELVAMTIQGAFGCVQASSSENVPVRAFHADASLIRIAGPPGS